MRPLTWINVAFIIYFGHIIFYSSQLKGFNRYVQTAKSYHEEILNIYDNRNKLKKFIDDTNQGIKDINDHLRVLLEKVNKHVGSPLSVNDFENAMIPIVNLLNDSKEALERISKDYIKQFNENIIMYVNNESLEFTTFKLVSFDFSLNVSDVQNKILSEIDELYVEYLKAYVHQKDIFIERSISVVLDNLKSFGFETFQEFEDTFVEWINDSKKEDKIKILEQFHKYHLLNKDIVIEEYVNKDEKWYFEQSFVEDYNEEQTFDILQNIVNTNAILSLYQLIEKRSFDFYKYIDRLVENIVKTQAYKLLVQVKNMNENVYSLSFHKQTTEHLVNALHESDLELHKDKHIIQSYFDRIYNSEYIALNNLDHIESTYLEKHDELYKETKIFWIRLFTNIQEYRDRLSELIKIDILNQQYFDILARLTKKELHVFVNALVMLLIQVVETRDHYLELMKIIKQYQHLIILDADKHVYNQKYFGFIEIRKKLLENEAMMVRVINKIEQKRLLLKEIKEW